MSRKRVAMGGAASRQACTCMHAERRLPRDNRLSIDVHGLLQLREVMKGCSDACDTVISFGRLCTPSQSTGAWPARIQARTVLSPTPDTRPHVDREAPCSYWGAHSAIALARLCRPKLYRCQARRRASNLQASAAGQRKLRVAGSTADGLAARPVRTTCKFHRHARSRASAVPQMEATNTQQLV